MGYYMDDCVHLKACRRLQKICKSRLDVTIPRYCDSDCSAYFNGTDEKYVTISEALNYARSGISSIRSGYDPYDIYSITDLPGFCINEIIESQNDN